MRFRAFQRHALVVDVGSQNTVLAAPHRDLLRRVPSRVAIAFSSSVLARNEAPAPSQGRVVAVGAEAASASGGRRNQVRIFAPVRRGLLVQPVVCELLLQGLLRREGLRTWLTRLVGGTLGMLVPAGLSGEQERAVRDLVKELGYSRVELVEAPRAAAHGCGLDITRANGQMVMDLGAGKLSMATFSLGGLAAWSQTPIGGEDLTQALQAYIEQRYRVRLSRGAAEHVKRTVGSVYPKARPESLDVTGVDVASGIDKRIVVDDNEARDVLIDACEPLVMAIQQGFETVPPELAADVAREGVHLVGGGALLDGLTSFLRERTGLAFRPAPDPLGAAVRGAVALLRESTDGGRKA